MKTYFAKPQEIEKKWYLIDASGKVLGRLATKIATLLLGKRKPFFTPYLDCGDYVIVTNAEKVRLTGKKLKQKIAYRHSGYPRGDKYTPYEKLLKENPERAIYLAVKGMLPKNKLGRKLLTKLKVYQGNVHPHQPQQPTVPDGRQVELRD